MLISIIIPVFNKGDYIRTTLESVLSQTYSEYEVVVVDDGSTDLGLDVIDQFIEIDARFRLVRQTNAGVSTARNRGIAEAKGAWVAFLDADDWWHPQYLEKQYSAIQSYPEVDIVATQLRKIPDAINWSPVPWPDFASELIVALINDLPQRWMQGIPFFTSSVIVRRSRLNAMQPCFVAGESYGEDLDLWFRLAEHSDIAHTQAQMVAYRSAAVGSLTSKQRTLLPAPYLQRMKLRALAGEMPMAKRRSALNFVAQQQITLARAALMQGQRLKGLRWLWGGKDALLTKRWWLTLVMAVLFPGVFITYWEQWRNNRAASAP